MVFCRLHKFACNNNTMRHNNPMTATRLTNMSCWCWTYVYLFTCRTHFILTPALRRYRRLYNAAIKDRALTYAWFFIFYLVHIAFCVWSAISPPLPSANDWSHTGFIACLKAFKANKFVGVLYVIGGALWTVESLWSLWVLKTVNVLLGIPCKTQCLSVLQDSLCSSCTCWRLCVGTA